MVRDTAEAGLKRQFIRLDDEDCVCKINKRDNDVFNTFKKELAVFSIDGRLREVLVTSMVL
jgi:hypothetical protein